MHTKIMLMEWCSFMWLSYCILMVGEYHGIKFLGCHLMICEGFKHDEYAMHFVLFNQDKKE